MSLERATAALSSADMAQPIFGKLQSFRRDNVAAAMFLDSGGGVLITSSRGSRSLVQFFGYVRTNGLAVAKRFASFPAGGKKIKDGQGRVGGR